MVVVYRTYCVMPLDSLALLKSPTIIMAECGWLILHNSTKFSTSSMVAVVSASGGM